MHADAAQLGGPDRRSTDHALAVGFSRGFEVSAGIMLIALIVTIAAIRVTRADLAGAQTALASPAGDAVTMEAMRIE